MMRPQPTVALRPMGRSRSPGIALSRADTETLMRKHADA
jgi:hypothetical protein